MGYSVKSSGVTRVIPGEISTRSTPSEEQRRPQEVDELRCEE